MRQISSNHRLPFASEMCTRSPNTFYSSALLGQTSSAGFLAYASKLDVSSQKDQGLRNQQMTFGVVFLAANVTIGNGNDQIDEWIERILFKTIHVLN
ncbi:hypothetical protein BpHYR1_046008 [Brachionus plicatilis]|uniref:Uncharacterized protein n=1 Tax=Brachionus plicatilis TaxID=10195 RepID=A0A3M7Q099_BRAPC|nr:hypothetical protein BpHYR1_046008 [Brachionus plicatilis]